MLQAKQKARMLADLGREWLLPARLDKMQRRFWPFLIGGGYIALIGALGGLRGDHVMIGCLCLLDAYNEKTRLFLRYFFPFILTGAVYDSMRYFYWQGIEGRVHVAEPYLLEKSLFGIPLLSTEGNAILTPNEFFARYHWPTTDLLCGFAYLTFVGEYLATGFLLFFRRNFELLKIFGWCFFTVNVMGFVTYFIYAAAPPWYVAQYGLGPARTDVHSNAAAASRFDQILGTHFFDQIYGRGIDVYGAYPSLHVSYPFLVTWVAFKTGRLRAPAAAFYLLMCFSAIYLQHHYIVDVILGTLYATVTVITISWALGQKSSTETHPLSMVSTKNPSKA